MARGLGRIIGCMLIAAALGGCSAVKLGYDNLDQIAYWWLDAYLDFNDEQSRNLREDLARLHDWHRREELPKAIALLKSMEEAAAGDVTPAQACAFIPRLSERLSAVAEQAMPAAVTLALSLGEPQLVHLKRKYARHNEDFAKDWIRISPRERIDKRLRQFVDRAESFYGQVEASQREALRAAIASSLFDPERTLVERRRRQGEVLAALRRVRDGGVSLADAQPLLRGLVDQQLESPDLGYRTYQRALWEESCRNLATLHNTATAAQREAAVRRLGTYQRQLRELTRGR